MTDGPSGDAAEALAGFWVLDAPDLDAALDVARRRPAASGPRRDPPRPSVNPVIDDVHRREWAGVVATLARSFGLDVAEDAAAEAFAAAVERWPVDGVPDNPGAWLTTAARRRPLDRVRREASRAERQAAAHDLLAATPGGDRRPSTTARSPTTGCASSSRAATPPWLPRPGSRSPCACSAG